jgi:hypothetical protein
MSPVGLGTKNSCIGEGQQQFTLTEPVTCYRHPWQIVKNNEEMVETMQH